MFFKWNRFHKDAEKLSRGEISIETFLQKHARKKLFYSTPFGEDAGGKQQLWALSSRESEIKYMPAFTSKDHCCAFLTMIGRRNFTIIKGDLAAFLDALDAHPILAELGAVIDPDTDSPIEFPPHVRV